MLPRLEFLFGAIDAIDLPQSAANHAWVCRAVGWIDLTDVQATDRSSHAKFAQLAQIAPEMRQVFEGGVATQGKAETLKGQETLASVVEGPGGFGAPIRVIRAGQ